jgi:hypothetical protein
MKEFKLLEHCMKYEQEKNILIEKLKFEETWTEKHVQ